MESIHNATCIPCDDLCKILEIMVFGRYKVLITNNGKITEESIFKANDSFYNRVKSFHLSSPVIVPTITTKTATIKEDRSFVIDAVIIRIMKARRVMTHHNLVAEVVSQTSATFIAEPSTIKQRIASLIEREYIARDPENIQSYDYIA